MSLHCSENWEKIALNNNFKFWLSVFLVHSRIFRSYLLFRWSTTYDMTNWSTNARICNSTREAGLQIRLIKLLPRSVRRTSHSLAYLCLTNPSFLLWTLNRWSSDRPGVYQKFRMPSWLREFSRKTPEKNSFPAIDVADWLKVKGTGSWSERLDCSAVTIFRLHKWFLKICEVI